MIADKDHFWRLDKHILKEFYSIKFSFFISLINVYPFDFILQILSLIFEITVSL